MTKISKLILVGALLVSTLSAASAQGFSGAHDNEPASNSQQMPKNTNDVGENGGAYSTLGGDHIPARQKRRFGSHRRPLIFRPGGCDTLADFDTARAPNR